jgi:hypothetical protein
MDHSFANRFDTRSFYQSQHWKWSGVSFKSRLQAMKIEECQYLCHRSPLLSSIAADGFFDCGGWTILLPRE